ncbi:MAG: cell wall anchor protein [Muribaculaceae bacterium]|nr:cell wall anchor protein [Muribaculaceae bacterium]
MKSLRYILSATLLTAAIGAAGAKSSVTATLDSSYITMGNVTCLTVDIVEPREAHSQVGFLPGTMPAEVEVVGEASCDTVDLDANIRQITRRIILQSFDSGAYTLPPIFWESAGDTMLSNMVTLKVNPVDVSHLEDIHPNADTMSIASRWYDFLPDWLVDYWGWLLLTIVIVAGGVCAILIYQKRIPLTLIPAKKPVPPYEMACQRLNTLREQHYCERGQEREYYTELTDILREYIDKRFGINAMEMTSRQILEHLGANEITRPSERLMRQILEVADFVKFAKMRPMPDDNVKSFNSAMKFVEDTKPQAVEEEAEDAENDNDTAAAPQSNTTEKPTKAE